MFVCHYTFLLIYKSLWNVLGRNNQLCPFINHKKQQLSSFFHLQKDGKKQKTKNRHISTHTRKHGKSKQQIFRNKRTNTKQIIRYKTNKCDNKIPQKLNIPKKQNNVKLPGGKSIQYVWSTRSSGSEIGLHCL